IRRRRTSADMGRLPRTGRASASGWITEFPPRFWGAEPPTVATGGPRQGAIFVDISWRRGIRRSPTLRTNSSVAGTAWRGLARIPAIALDVLPDVFRCFTGRRHRDPPFTAVS